MITNELKNIQNITGKNCKVIKDKRQHKLIINGTCNLKTRKGYTFKLTGRNNAEKTFYCKKSNKGAEIDQQVDIVKQSKNKRFHNCLKMSLSKAMKINCGNSAKVAMCKIKCIQGYHKKIGEKKRKTFYTYCKPTNLYDPEPECVING